jgi:hypothetical protein
MLRDVTTRRKWLIGALIVAGMVSVWGVRVIHSTRYTQAQSNANTAPAPAVPDCPDTTGSHLNFSSGTWVCGNTSSSSSQSYLTGATGNIGGGLLLLGNNASGTATVTGASVGMPCVATPSDGTNIAALGLAIECTVTASNTVTVNAVAFVSVTPPAKSYSVRVFP